MDSEIFYSLMGMWMGSCKFDYKLTFGQFRRLGNGDWPVGNEMGDLQLFTMQVDSQLQI